MNKLITFLMTLLLTSCSTPYILELKKCYKFYSNANKLSMPIDHGDISMQVQSLIQLEGQVLVTVMECPE